MHFGLILSALIHVAILGCTLFAFQSQRQLPTPETVPVAVGMITPSELTKVPKGLPTAKQPETEAKQSPKGEVARKEDAKARPVAAAPPPPPPEPPAPKAERKADPIAKKLTEAPPAAPPPPAPAPDEKKTPDAAQAEKLKADEQRAADALRQAEEKRAEEQKRAEQKRAQEQKRAEERRRKAELKRQEEKRRREAALRKKREDEKKRLEAEAAAKSKFDADRIAALLNKVPDRSAPPPSDPPNEPTKAKGPALGAADGRDKQLSASEIAMLKARISSQIKQKDCWRLPAGGGGSDLPVVTVRWRLKPDGRLDGEPQIEQPRADALFRVAAEAALRAVRACAPFDLPPDKYSAWRLIIWDFDPSAML